jgi:hypothetical protein
VLYMRGRIQNIITLVQAELKFPGATDAKPSQAAKLDCLMRAGGHL